MFSFLNNGGYRSGRSYGRYDPFSGLYSYDSDDDSYGGYGYGGGHYGWGPDRRGWAEKSEAALERERFADAAFDRFWARCSKLPVGSTAFPVTEEINKADNHLTSACWTSFHRRVESKGCKAKRREATDAEKKEAHHHRKGKAYVISVTMPVHPSNMNEYLENQKKEAAARKEKAKLAKERKLEKERLAKEERERLAKLHREKVRQEYAKLAEIEDKDHSKTPKKEANVVSETSPTSVAMIMSPKDEDAIKITADDLIKHAKSVLNSNELSIWKNIGNEKTKREHEIEKKFDTDMEECRSYFRDKIEASLSDARTAFKEIEEKIKATYPSMEQSKGNAKAPRAA